jgi:opacity protein-like surface antigen
MKQIKHTLLFVLLLGSFVTFGQHKPFQFGFSGGLNIGWMATNADGYNSNGAKVGGSWGFVVDIFLMEGYAFTTGFNVLFINSSLSYPYDASGEASSQSTPGTIQRDFKTRYVQLPLILTMKTKPIKEKVKIFGQVGFGLAFLLNAKSTDRFTPDEGGQSFTEENNASDDFRFTRESLILGTGVEMPVHESMFVRTGIRFDNSFTNVLKGYNNLNSDVKNNGRNSFIEIFAAIIF